MPDVVEVTCPPLDKSLYNHTGDSSSVPAFHNLDIHCLGEMYEVKATCKQYSTVHWSMGMLVWETGCGMHLLSYLELSLSLRIPTHVSSLLPLLLFFPPPFGPALPSFNMYHSFLILTSLLQYVPFLPYSHYSPSICTIPFSYFLYHCRIWQILSAFHKLPAGQSIAKSELYHSRQRGFTHSEWWPPDTYLSPKPPSHWRWSQHGIYMWLVSTCYCQLLLSVAIVNCYCQLASLIVSIMEHEQNETYDIGKG